MLSRVYRAKFMEGLKSLYSSDDLVFPSELKPLEEPQAFQTFVNDLFKKEWIVFSKRVFKKANHVIKYLGRYTHKIAIYADRIIDFNEESVTFSS